MFIEYLEGQKHARRNADISQSLDAFKDAGYVLTDNDLIIDIDNLSHEQIRQIIKMFNIQTETVWTERGVHFYFKKPEGFRGAKGMCALGVEVEYKHITNTKSITVKRNGVARNVDFKGIRENLPSYFKKGSYDSLLGLSEGDGRDNAMMKHRGKIQHLVEWQTVMQVVNEVIFDEPFDSTDMQRLTREMTIEAVADGETKIADFILQEKRVVKYMGNLYYFDGRGFTSDSDSMTRMVYRYCEGQKSRYVKEVIEQLGMRCEVIPADTEFDIKFENGILRNGKFIEVEYKDFTPYTIPVNYKEDATPVSEVDDYLNQLTDSDPEYRKQLVEILAHPLVVDKEFKRILAKFFIFVGDGGNGKGTLLTIIRGILGTNNCSSLSIREMADERYITSLQGKLANLGDDIQDEPINNDQMKMLKNISTCDVIELRRLYEQSSSVQLSTSLIFTSNHKIKSFEKGTSYKRRVDWLPMYTKPKKKDPKFISKLTTPEALEYWIRVIVEGYFRLYQQGKFTESEVVQQMNDEYHADNNTAIEFINDLEPKDIYKMRAPEIYVEYETWCEENGLNLQSQKLFKETVKDIYGLDTKPTKINGKTQRVYRETELTPIEVLKQLEEVLPDDSEGLLTLKNARISDGHASLEEVSHD